MAQVGTGKRQPPLFDLTGGNVCLDFINTLDDRPSSQPKELLNEYRDLARFGENTGIVTPAEFQRLATKARSEPSESEQALWRARELREALNEIFSAVESKQAASQTAIDKLNAVLHEAERHSRLVESEEGFAWRSDAASSTLTAILWPIARAARDLLTSAQLPMVRKCSSPTCQWFFLDSSKNHRRRWCDMTTCGNRDKVRNFYARKRGATETA